MEASFSASHRRYLHWNVPYSANGISLFLGKWWFPDFAALNLLKVVGVKMASSNAHLLGISTSYGLPTVPRSHFQKGYDSNFILTPKKS